MKVGAQESIPIVYRGDNYIDTDLGNGTHSWQSAPQWVFNGSHYVPYIYEETDNYYQVQSGLIGARIFKSGYAEFWNPEMTEARLYDETWEVQYWTGNKWSVCDTYDPIYSVESDDKNVNITASFSTDWPNSGERALTIKYIFREGSALKHEIDFVSYASEQYAFRVLQKWAGIIAERVQHDNGETVIASAITVNSSKFRFLKEDGSLSVFENQWDMYYGYNETDGSYYVLENENLKPVEIDIHAQGLKADFVFGNWTLVQGESLIVDPATATLDDPTEDGHIYHTSSYTRQNDQVSLQMGVSSSFNFRAYVEWDVSSIPDCVVTDTIFKYHGKSKKRDCQVRKMDYQPSVTADSTVWADAGSDTIYATPAGFPEVGQNKQVDLGTSADSDLQSQLSVGWFAIGLRYDNESPGDVGSYSYIYAEEYASANPKPTLYVTYTPAPTITTQDPTGIGASVATLHGTITDTGNGNADERGFDWDTDSGAPYANSWTEIGSYGTGAFSHEVTGLPEGETIYFRAKAHNPTTGIWGYGSELFFPVGGIERKDTTNADFDAGSHDDTKAEDNNLKLGSSTGLFTILSGLSETGWGSGSSNSQDPYNTYYYDGRGQFVILASELSNAGLSAGDISKMQIHVNQMPGRDLRYFRIRMQHTSATTSTSFITSGWTLVYGPTTIPRTSVVAGQWYEHVFTTPFPWNGVNNLLIDLTLDGTGYTSGGGMYTRGNGLTNRMCAGRYDSGYTYPFDTMPETDYSKVPSIKLDAAGGYVASGVYTSASLDLSTLDSCDDSLISWSATLNGQTLSVYSRYSTNGGAGWSGWAACTSGQPMSGVGGIGSNTANALVQYKVEMSGDGQSSPLLHDITMICLSTVSTATVTTLSATLVEETTANPRGQVTDTGGDNPTRYIQYGTSTGSYPSEKNCGVGGVGIYNSNLVSLTPGQRYFYRAKVVNSGGTSYGSEMNFYTKPGSPSALSATVVSSTQIDLAWTKGTGGDKTHIRRKIGSYPISISDGDQAYFDTGVSKEDTGLVGGNNYYYRGWAYDTDSGYYSSGYTEDWDRTPQTHETEVSQSLSLGSDSYRICSTGRTLSQGMTLTSKGQRTLGAQRELSQSFSWSGVAYRSCTFNRDGVQGVSLSSDGYRTFGALRKPTQGLTLASSTSRIWQLLRGLDQSLSVTPTAGRQWSLMREFTQGVSTAFSGNRILTALRGLSQTINSVVNADRVLTAVRTASQAITSTFNTERSWSLSRTVSAFIIFQRENLLQNPSLEDPWYLMNEQDENHTINRPDKWTVSYGYGNSDKLLALEETTIVRKRDSAIRLEYLMIGEDFTGSLSVRNSANRIDINENQYLEGGGFQYPIIGPTSYSDQTFLFYDSEGQYLCRRWAQNGIVEDLGDGWKIVSFVWKPSYLDPNPPNASGHYPYIPEGATTAYFCQYFVWHGGPTERKAVFDEFFAFQWSAMPTEKQRINRALGVPDAERDWSLMRVFTQGITTGFTGNRILMAVRDLTQTITTTVNANRILTAIRTLAQTINPTFNTERLWSTLRTVSQGLSTTMNGGRQWSLMRTFAQGVSTTFNGNRILTALRGVSQIITTTISADRVLAAIRTLAQSLGIISSIGRTWSTTRILTQAITSTFNTERLWVLMRTFTQGVSLTFNGDRILTAIRSLSQGISASFNGERMMALIRMVSQGMTASFGTGRLWSTTRTVVQTVSTAFNTDRFWSTLRSVSQGISANFNGERMLTALRGLTQGMSFTFNGERVMNLIRSASQAISTSFDTFRSWTLLKTVSQTISLGLDTERYWATFRLLTQTISTTLNSGRLWDMMRSVTQGITATFNAEKTWDTIRTVSQTIAATFDIERVWSTSRTITQGINAVFNSGRLWSLSRIVSQSISLVSSAFSEKFIHFMERTVSLMVETSFNAFREWSLLRTGIQSLTANFNAERLWTLLRLSSQTVGISFNALREWSLMKELSQSITATFDADRVLTAIRILPQTLTASFNSLRSWSLLKTVVQSISLDITSERSWATSRLLTQTISTIFNTERLWSLSRAFTQEISTTFNGERILVAVRGLSQTITAVFNGERFLTAMRIVPQSITAGFNANRGWTLLRTLTQPLTGNFNAGRWWIQIRIVTQTISTSFNSVRFWMAFRDMAQTISTSLSVERICTFPREFTQGLTLSFNALFDLPAFVRHVSASINVATQTLRSWSLSRTLSQGLSFISGVSTIIGEMKMRLVSLNIQVTIALTMFITVINEFSVTTVMLSLITLLSSFQFLMKGRNTAWGAISTVLWFITGLSTIQSNPGDWVAVRVYSMFGTIMIVLTLISAAKSLNPDDPYFDDWE